MVNIDFCGPKERTEFGSIICVLEDRQLFLERDSLE